MHGLLTDISPQDCLNLFLLEFALDDELTGAINRTTAMKKTQDVVIG